MLIFQISLNINDLAVLEKIKEKLKCGHISISGTKCNYFVNDKNSITQVIIPVFKYAKLHSSKFYQFLIF
jgi:hypothetical protein